MDAENYAPLEGVTAMFSESQAFVGAIYDLNWYKVAVTSEADAKRLQLGILVRFKLPTST